MPPGCPRTLCTLPLLLALALPARGQHGAAGGEWPHYGGDLGSTRYAPLSQIDRTNVARLQRAWTWISVDEALPENEQSGHFKTTPLMVGGVLYVTTSLHQVAALDAASGKTSWVYDPKVYAVGRPVNSGFQHRGVEYYRDGEFERIYVANGARQLIALDPKTGEPDGRFGNDGVVDTTKGLGRDFNPRQYGHNAPPIVCAGTIVLGSLVSDGPTNKEMPPGHVRGYDPRTGEQEWIFHTIAQPGEPGAETWQGGSNLYTGNTNVWSMMSCDQELGYVYLPLTTPTNDWYGGNRKGDNLYAESLVALDARTGERKWHFQAVHHGLWDYDFPCAPNLVDITVAGRKIAAVAQVSKQGFTYVFDRKTGEPVWPIEERPVPPSDVPGEWTSPTQPFPTKPPPFERQGVTVDDLIDWTPGLRQQALAIASEYHLGPLFTPPTVITERKKGVLMLPNAAGGANWRGAAVDPETATLFVPSMTLLMVNGLRAADPARSNLGYTYGASFLVPGPQGLPLVKPPYMRLTAIDLDRGEHRWQVPLGSGPKDHPAIAHLALPDLGANANGVLSNGGIVATRTLVFAIQAKLDEQHMTRMGDSGTLAAFDKVSGETVWETEITPTPHGNPMTYLHQGKQYLVVALGGWGQPAELAAFALPEGPAR